ncbi:uncharacterized protein LOC110992476 isoform X2 [Pieris rapae]|uniref:uncharacterized protein LOC110992476 isoform X2 n=1 Tax=Pieris rapae TaxID=64459 RepID=UPI001E27D3A9|nr:uncharacterized protein LOC110992476 isoform X2 [Pieris rapae]
MRLKAVLVLFIFTCICARTYGNKICYFAKTCIHDAKEKCGEDGKGNVRRFLDSCDIKEYNCLHGTDYKKTSLEYCHSLPSIQDNQVKTTLPSTNKEKFKESEEKGSTQAQLEQEVSDKESVSQQQSSRETSEDQQTPKEIDLDEGSNVKESMEEQEENDSNLKESKEETEINSATNANETEVNAESTHESSNDNTKLI